nr:PRC-barrel domain containing protein [Cytophagales bacterium]
MKENPEATPLLSASTISGTTVKNLRDDTIGEIKDIMLYKDTGEIAYAVLSVHTGFLNLESKYFAIPWEAMSFIRADRSGEEVITLDVDKHKLENSPGFDKDDWPMTPQSEVISAAFKYYDVPLRNRRFTT